MGYNTLNIKITQDPRKNVECWHFSEDEIKHHEALLNAHNDVFDMFLCRQPLLVLPEKRAQNRGTSVVSERAKLIKPEFLTPPYPQFMLNTFAIELLQGETVQEKMSWLIELDAPLHQKESLVLLLYELSDQGLYTVVACM